MEQQIQALLTPHGALPAKALPTRNVVKPALASGPPPFGSQSAAAAPSVGGQSAVTLSSTPAAANQGIPVVEVVDDQPAESPAPEAPDESWIDELLVDFVHACQEDYDALVNDLWACAKIMKDKATKEYDSLQRNIRESAADAAILVRDENGGITGISESIAPTNTKMREHLSTRYKRDLTWLHMEYACNQFARDDTGLHADAYIDSKMPVEIQKSAIGSGFLQPSKASLDGSITLEKSCHRGFNLSPPLTHRLISRTATSAPVTSNLGLLCCRKAATVARPLCTHFTRPISNCLPRSCQRNPVSH